MQLDKIAYLENENTIWRNGGISEMIQNSQRKRRIEELESANYTLRTENLMLSTKCNNNAEGERRKRKKVSDAQNSPLTLPILPEGGGEKMSVAEEDIVHV